MRSLLPILEIAALVLVPLAMLAGYMLFAETAARQLGIFDMPGDYLAGVLAAIAMLFGIQLLPLAGTERRALSILWALRCGVTLGAMLFYESYYGLDAGMYFRVGTNLSDPAARLAFGAGTYNIQGLVGLLSEISGSYSLLKVLFSLIGLAAVYLFYRAVRLALGGPRIVLLYALGLFPSLLFWSSILGKDPIVLLGLGLYCYGVVGLLMRHDLAYGVAVILGLVIAASIRTWLGIIFIVPLIATYVLSARSSIILKAGFMAMAVPGFLLALQGFAARFRIETAEDVVARTDTLSQGWARGGSAQVIENGFDSFAAMIAFIPLGAFTALFRPLPGEVLNPFGLLAGLENAAILGLLSLGVWRRGIGWVTHPLLLWAVLSLGCWAAVYGFVSFQNLGSAFRFRVQVAPILLMLALFLAFGHWLSRTETGPDPSADRSAAAPPERTP